jgi:hypothetical protein
LAEALALVRRHPALFHAVYPPRQVNNVYLDSPGLKDYFDHVSGIPDRVKTRIRWYGRLSGDIETPILERKVKRGSISGKSAHRLPRLSVDGATSLAAVDAVLRNADLPAIMHPLARCLRPSLLNRYQRHYFLSADRRFRLTVDSDLQFLGLHRFTNWMPSAWAPELVVIVELKFDPCHAEQAADVTNALPFRLARCSKYVLGIESTAQW